MNTMNKMMMQKDITHLGRIGHEQVNMEMRTAHIWSYPCLFPENCSTLSIKAVASDLVPVIIQSGGLIETVEDGYISRDRLWQRGVFDEEAAKKALDDWRRNMIDVMSTRSTVLKKGAKNTNLYRVTRSYNNSIGKFLHFIGEIF